MDYIQTCNFDVPVWVVFLVSTITVFLAVGWLYHMDRLINAVNSAQYVNEEVKNAVNQLRGEVRQIGNRIHLNQKHRRNRGN